MGYCVDRYNGNGKKVCEAYARWRLARTLCMSMIVLPLPLWQTRLHVADVGRNTQVLYKPIKTHVHPSSDVPPISRAPYFTYAAIKLTMSTTNISCLLCFMFKHCLGDDFGVPDFAVAVHHS